MDRGDFWEADVSTPITMDGVARPMARDGPLPLGLSRGTRLSRPKQIDFMQRFMAVPLGPSFSGGPGGPGFSLLRALTLPFGNDWFTSLLGQFNLQKFVSSVRKAKLMEPSDSSWMQVMGRHLSDKSFYALGFCSEFVVTSDDTLLLACEAHGDTEIARKKAVFHHKFPRHDLTMEAAWPGLFIDKHGNYWDVPVFVAADLASVTCDSGASYHLCLQHISGPAKQVGGGESRHIPTSLLPGVCLKSAFCFKKNIDLWRSQTKKSFDVLLSNPHVSATGIVGAVATALVGDNSLRSQVDDEPKGYRHFNLYSSRVKSAFLADLFASFSFSAQYGDFQKLFFDLTRVHVRVEVPSGSRFLSAAACLARDLYNSQQPSLEALQAVRPNATFSFQQQIAGPFSFRVDSAVAVNLNNREWKVNLENPVFAIEYALQVLVSAKAVAWYAPKQKEFMLELRFLER